MKYLNSDLLGHRCPDVAQKMLKTLKLLMESDEMFAVITTIEPSARRDLSAAISLHYAGRIELSEVQEVKITLERRAEILSSSEGFDAEDLAGTSLQLIMLVSKVGALVKGT
jgi:TusA-related sulfurtransferase